MPARRLPQAPASEPVRFAWGRRRVEGRTGDTVASALVAAGHTVLSRSLKYHRPRGYLCGVGRCGNCLVTIDGKPSQRACLVPLRGGQRVEPQNCWPGPRLDVFALTDKLFPRGFDPQRSFLRPRFIVPLYYHAVRAMAGLGKAPWDATPARVGPVAQQACALAVVGAGPAGLAAAAEAARAGVEVRLFDERPWAGGRLRLEGGALAGPGAFEGRTPEDAFGVLRDDLAQAGVAPEARANVAGIYGDRLLAVQTPQRLVEVRARAVVLATGAPESLPLFGDNDRPGIMSATAAAILLRRHGVLPGERAVLLGADARARGLAADLARAGARVEAFVVGPEDPAPERVEGARVVRGTVTRAFGGQQVKGLEVATAQGPVPLSCDLVAFSEPRRPAVELAQQAGCPLEDRGLVALPRTDAGLATGAPGVFAAGDLAGPGSLEAALASGQVAGMRAAQALGAKVDEARLDAALAALRAAREAP